MAIKLAHPRHLVSIRQKASDHRAAAFPVSAPVQSYPDPARPSPSSRPEDRGGGGGGGRPAQSIRSNPYRSVHNGGGGGVPGRYTGGAGRYTGRPMKTR